MTIFITGGSGFVGQAVRRVAQTIHGQEVVIIPRLGAPEFLRRRLAGGVDRATVVHLAWPKLHQSVGAAHEAGAGWREFLDWSIALRVAAAEADAWFVGTGSGLEICAANAAVDLGEPYHTYTRQKAELMTALRSAAPEKMSWVRLHFMFGPFENPLRFVPAAVRACLDGTEFACGRRDRQRRWLHVDDAAKVVLDFAAAPDVGAWDIAGRQDLSFQEMLGLVARAVGRPLRLSRMEAPSSDAKLDVVAPTRMARIVPEWAGRTDNLVARLAEYARSLGAGGSNVGVPSKNAGAGYGRRA